MNYRLVHLNAWNPTTFSWLLNTNPPPNINPRSVWKFSRSISNSAEYFICETLRVCYLSSSQCFTFLLSSTIYEEKIYLMNSDLHNEDWVYLIFVEPRIYHLHFPRESKMSAQGEALTGLGARRGSRRGSQAISEKIQSSSLFVQAS